LIKAHSKRVSEVSSSKFIIDDKRPLFFYAVPQAWTGKRPNALPASLLFGCIGDFICMAGQEERIYIADSHLCIHWGIKESLLKFSNDILSVIQSRGRQNFE
jgi:hypothetical protein